MKDKAKGKKEVSHKDTSGPISQHKRMAMGKPIPQGKQTKAPK